MEVYVKHRGSGPAGLAGSVHVAPHHPFDVVGWDGCLYPYTFNVADFEPITGRVHQPPPVHQVFEGNNFVICNFVPRKVDYHPLSIPVPYYHSNVDSDEVMFYCGGDYEARKGSGIGQGSVSLHPGGYSTDRSRAPTSDPSAWSSSTSSRSWSTPSARCASARAAAPPTTAATPGAGPGGGREAERPGRSALRHIARSWPVLHTCAQGRGPEPRRRVNQLPSGGPDVPATMTLVQRCDVVAAVLAGPRAAAQRRRGSGRAAAPGRAGPSFPRGVSGADPRAGGR